MALSDSLSGSASESDSESEAQTESKGTWRSWSDTSLNEKQVAFECLCWLRDTMSKSFDEVVNQNYERN